MGIGEGGLRAPERNIVAWTEDDYWDPVKLDEETRRQFDVCHGCRRCFNLCDSFPKLFDLIDESKTFELDSVKSEDFKPVVDSCTLCDMCFMVTCPYVPPHEFAIDIPKLMLRHRAKDFKNGKIGFKEKQIAEIDRNGKLGQKTRFISNVFISLKNKPARYIFEKILNIDKKAKLPNFSKPFNKSFLINKEAPGYGKKAILFSTCYGSYHNSEIISSTYKVLSHNGIDVSLFYDGCCGMPQLEQGNIESVVQKARATSEKLVNLINEGIKVIVPIPSCALMFKTEWPLILPQDKNIKILSEIIQSKIELGLQLDTSILSDFEKQTRDKNLIFSNGIDFIYEFFNIEKKIKNKNLTKILKNIGKNKDFNNLLIKFADRGINF